MEKFTVLKKLQKLGSSGHTLEELLDAINVGLSECEESQLFNYYHQVTIEEPPTKYTDRKKNKIDPNTGRLKEVVYYLTNNIFYQGVHFAIRSKIVEDVKRYLVPHLKELPKLQKLRIEIIYYKEKDGFDLDNKIGFWLKMLLDLLKVPSKRQRTKALQQRRVIQTIEVLPDDTVKYIDDIHFKYRKGPHKIVINFYGITPEVGTLFGNN